MKLIYAEKLKNSYGWWEGNDRQLTRDEVRHYFDAMIDAQAPVEAEPVRHGKWLIYNILDYAKRPTGRKVAKCSICGQLTPDFRSLLEPNWNYCPNCGAKMDEVELTTSAEMHPEKYLKNLNEVKE